MDLASIIVGIIGALLSGYGAYIAIKEARKAKESATKAEKMKEAITIEQNKISLGRLFNETKNIMRISIKLATSATPDKKLRGLNYQESIDKIRQYIDILKEHYHYLPEEKVPVCEEEYRKVESLIIDLARESDQSEKYQIGDKIHNCMGEILKLIKPELDVKTFANTV